jgi:O-acetyl-ADP-ribose deacetylase (regulator of RNase III)
MPHKINNTVIEVIKDDITMLDVEAIVNPANNYLIHGGGLAAAIVRRGGQIIQQESKKIGFVPTGHAVYTTGGHLKAGYVIHAVGPRYKDGNSGEPEKLASAVKTALDIANKKKLKSVALPAISAGIFGYPVGACAEVITKAVTEFISETPETTLEKVVLCLFDDEAFGEFEKQVKTIPEIKTKAGSKKKKSEEPVEEIKKTKEKIKAQTEKAKSTKVKIEKAHAMTKKTGTTAKRTTK